MADFDFDKSFTSLKLPVRGGFWSKIQNETYLWVSHIPDNNISRIFEKSKIGTPPIPTVNTTSGGLFKDRSSEGTDDDLKGTISRAFWSKVEGLDLKQLIERQAGYEPGPNYGCGE